MAHRETIEREARWKWELGEPDRQMQREKDIKLMRVALAIAELSKCHRAKYGALILRADGTPASWGFNGKPRGSCCDQRCLREGLAPGASGPNCCLHAESNCIDLGNYLDRQGGTFYVSGMPCSDCALRIMQSGVARVVVLDDPRGYQGMKTLETYGARLNITVLARCEVGLPSIDP